MSPHSLTRDCRAVLRGAVLENSPLQTHVDACELCREWLVRRAALQNVLAQPVKAPSESSSAAMLTSIRERIVQQCEDGPIGKALEASLPVAPLPGDETWPDPLLESDLASRLATRPESVTAAARHRDWTSVRAAVLEEISGRSARRTVRYRTLAGAGAGIAAALALCVLQLREQPAPEQPVVFTGIALIDIAALPDFGIAPMSILRNGGRK